MRFPHFLEEVFELCDSVTVLRDGRLVGNHRVADLDQKELIRLCRLAAKPVVVATQMLDSMVSAPAPTRAEAGCLRYELVEDPEDPANFTFVETWESETHLEAHLETPHLIHARQRYEELLEGQLELRKGLEIG